MITQPLLALVLALAAPAADPQPTFDGHWMSEAFYRSLEQSRSPMVAVKAGDPIEIKVDDTAEGRQLRVSNYHEGAPYRLVGVERAGENSLDLVVDYGWDEEETLSRFRVELSADGQRLEGALWDPEQKVAYVKLQGTVEENVNRLTLAGRYRDAKGKTWTFGLDGRGDFAGELGHYEIHLDPIGVEFHCDGFSFLPDGKEPRDQRSYAYRRQGGKVMLHELEWREDVQLTCGKLLAELTPLP